MTPTVGRPLMLDTSNSALDFPRRDVRWDLDGDGRYERAAADHVRLRVPRPSAGTHRVGVAITTTDGRTYRATQPVTVAARSG